MLIFFFNFILLISKLTAFLNFLLQIYNKMAESVECIKEIEEVEEEEEEEEESDYAEAEPVLAYSRIKNDVLGIIEKDSVSCIKADRKVEFKFIVNKNFNFFPSF